MKRFLLSAALAVTLSVLGVASCVHQPYTPAADGNFPPEIANIFISRCAVSGCHNAASYQNADNLLLDSWDHLFNGGITGAVVVPYSPMYSPLLYFVNTDSSLGTVAVPTMPYSTPTRVEHPLTKEEYLALETWISNGAPDKNGNIAFASNPDTRQKIYLTQQGCDLLAVIDQERNVVMRYIPVGMSAQVESPHCVRVSSDGLYAYVSFINGNYVQKIDTRTDQIVASANVGSGSWNIVYVAPADTAVVSSDWQGVGALAFMTSGTMQVHTPYLGNGLFVYPHGIASSIGFDTFYVTAQYGNVIYKVAPAIPFYKQLSLDGNPATAANDSALNAPNPHEILMSADYSRYFVTCQGTNEVRVLDARTDSVLAHIPVGTFPQEMAMSHTKPYLFVTCMEDAANTLAGRRGSVYVINYNTYEIVQVIYGDFYQPHGITVDDRSGLVYIASTNANPNGPAPHHATSCVGRPGWYTIYNLNTLQPFNDYRYEVTVMPYSFATRFKN